MRAISFSWIVVLRGKVDAYIELYTSVFVKLYLHKRCNLANLKKFFKLFKTLIARVFFLILALLICAGMNTATSIWGV